jgi:hypothetical protein
LFDDTDDETPERRRMIEHLDYEAVEAAEASIDAFVSKRDREREELNRVEDAWAESTRRHRRKVRLANGHAWIAYFDHLALCYERRADEFRDRSRKVAALVEALAEEEVA